MFRLFQMIKIQHFPSIKINSIILIIIQLLRKIDKKESFESVFSLSGFEFQVIKEYHEFRVAACHSHTRA